jgi:2-haloacid dehalogenase
MRALLFDVFGTCVDWRTSVQREAERYDLPEDFAQRWRDTYQPQLETVRSGQRPWVNLDVLHRIGLNQVIRDLDTYLTEPQRRELTTAWHRLDPWPDVVEGLTRLKENFIIAPCSNGHIALSVNLAKHAKLPWDAIVGAEIARAYKPDPSVYRESAYALGCEPHEVMFVAAHRDDLVAAARTGMQTAFVPRPKEPEGPPFEPDLVAWDFLELVP